MHMMRYRVYFFGDDFKGKILGKKPPEFIAEGVSAMCTIPVKPDGTMCAHNYHTVNKGYNKQLKRKVFEYEQKQKRCQA